MLVKRLIGLIVASALCSGCVTVYRKDNALYGKPMSIVIVADNDTVMLALEIK
jgi:hypothetical protein